MTGRSASAVAAAILLSAACIWPGVAQACKCWAPDEPTLLAASTLAVTGVVEPGAPEELSDGGGQAVRAWVTVQRRDKGDSRAVRIRVLTSNPRFANDYCNCATYLPADGAAHRFFLTPSQHHEGTWALIGLR